MNTGHLDRRPLIGAIVRALTTSIATTRADSGSQPDRDPTAREAKAPMVAVAQ